MCTLCLKDGIGPDFWALAHADEKGKIRAKAAILKKQIQETEILIASVAGCSDQGSIFALEIWLADLDFFKAQQYEIAQKL